MAIRNLAVELKMKLRPNLLYGSIAGAAQEHRSADLRLVEKANRAGLDHLAFFYSTLDDWIATYERLKAVRITPRVSIHHGLTMSLYYRDPDDNGAELSIDNVEKSKWHDWMRNSMKDNPIGAPMDPEELARKYHAGAPEEEIMRFSPSSGEIDPEVLRRMIE